MFPIRDANPQLNVPYVTYALIALNVTAWAALQNFGAAPGLQLSVCEFGLIPADLFATSSAATNDFCATVTGGSWANSITSMFMHGGWMHLIGNMWFLWVFGDNVEDSMGATRFACFYLLCGLAAAGAQVLSQPGSTIPMVGASGAIGGVMGAYIMLYPHVRVTMLVILVVVVTTFRVPAFFMLGYWMLVQVIGGFSSIGYEGGGTAFWAHVGGFAAGAALIWLFKDDRLLRNHPFHGWKKSANVVERWK